MSNPVASLEPVEIWSHFDQINAIPRASKKEEKIISFMMAFGEKLGLQTEKDHAGNVIIRKPATKGMEDRQTIVMQSHLDMVHQKNNDTDFDFDTQGIDMYIDGDWVKARGTTLGADNGIGVATIMGILASDSIVHPAIEALFTIDEETGMTGAIELKGDVLTGSIMLNLDTEDDRELTIGCAGGIDVTAEGNYTEEKAAQGDRFFKLKLKGCSGGHSGMDIHLGRANANKLINRVLYSLASNSDVRISEIDGGGLRNAIPRESVAVIALGEDKIQKVVNQLEEIKNEIKAEYNHTDPELELTLEPVEDNVSRTVMSKEIQQTFVNAVYACPNGIYRMTPEIEGLVQTSNNMARVLLGQGRYEVLCLTRSSVESEKLDLVNSINCTFRNTGASVSTSGTYPGWRPRPDADIVKIMADTYRKLFQDEPLVNACHAGLECGILGRNYPDMDMISFGPNIRGAHSPDEKVQISSVRKFWSLLIETLKAIPAK